MYYLIIGVAIFFFIWLILHVYGRFSFWGLARKHSKIFYSFIKKEDAWVIDDGALEINEEKYDGPFRLYLDGSGITIKFYGKIGEYEKSQEKFKNIVSNL